MTIRGTSALAAPIMACLLSGLTACGGQGVTGDVPPAAGGALPSPVSTAPTAPALAALRITTLDRAGAPLVATAALRDRAGALIVTVQTGTDGTALIPVPAGRYMVIAAAVAGLQPPRDASVTVVDGVTTAVVLRYHG